MAVWAIIILNIAALMLHVMGQKYVCPANEGISFTTNTGCHIYYQCENKTQRTGTCFPGKRFDIHSLSCRRMDQVDCNPEYAGVWRTVYRRPDHFGEELLAEGVPGVEGSVPGISGIGIGEASGLGGTLGSGGVTGVGGVPEQEIPGVIGTGGGTQEIGSNTGTGFGGMPGFGGEQGFGGMPGFGGEQGYGGVPGFGGGQGYGGMPGFGGGQGYGGMPGFGGGQGYGGVPGFGGGQGYGGMPGIGGGQEYGGMPGVGGLEGAQGIGSTSGLSRMPGVGGLGEPEEIGSVPAVGGITETNGIPGTNGITGGSFMVEGVQPTMEDLDNDIITTKLKSVENSTAKISTEGLDLSRNDVITKHGIIGLFNNEGTSNTKSTSEVGTKQDAINLISSNNIMRPDTEKSDIVHHSSSMSGAQKRLEEIMVETFLSVFKIRNNNKLSVIRNSDEDKSDISTIGRVSGIQFKNGYSVIEQVFETSDEMKTKNLNKRESVEDEVETKQQEGSWFWCGSGRIVFVPTNVDGNSVCLGLEDPESIDREGIGNKNDGHTYVGSNMIF